MGTDQIPSDILDLYEVHEWRHASAILMNDFPEEWQDIVTVLRGFRLLRSSVIVGGGGLSLIAQALDNPFKDLGWVTQPFETTVTVNKATLDSITHKVDRFKSRVALEVEWNNKDPFYARDLEAFARLFDLRAISIGVMITRCDELQGIFNGLYDVDGKSVGRKYGASTTHMSKLLPCMERGGAGGCPVLVFGITPRLYVED